MNKNNRILISIVVAIIVVVGAFTIDYIEGLHKVKKSISASVISTLMPNVKDFYKVGETVKINDISMTIDKVQASNGTREDRPDDGTEYFIVTVTVKNGSKNKINYDDNDFQIQDANEGVNNSVATMIDADQTFNNGVLAANGDVTGTITFLTIKGATGLSVNYNGDIFGHTVLHFKLN